MFSLIGDVFLMLPGNTSIPGLASFLVVQLFYIALFRQGQAWFPSEMASAYMLAVTASMYAIFRLRPGRPYRVEASARWVALSGAERLRVHGQRIVDCTRQV